ncbi:hypothetical protein SteCoe_12884 [Stentor coeruleus]|uniref:Uncharacterized protein n=1 Tax=Stentor coeruleus TaxID=5963 RepID=A0A1R2C9S0_9CILI|nr:hypothetical protein SteCoe_18015 [Stentor coeruleus]OMJ85754.1 hypothetical protein SteCoe_12884 [Stentor coeruleus]
MERAKKNSCGCFTFFKRRLRKQQDNSAVIENKDINCEEEIKSDHKDINISVDHSLVITQKLFSPSTYYKSTIIAPSCKTPHTHNHIPPFINAALNESRYDKNLHNQSLPTSSKINIKEISDSSLIIKEIFENPLRQPIMPSTQRNIRTRFIFQDFERPESIAPTPKNIQIVNARGVSCNDNSKDMIKPRNSSEGPILLVKPPEVIARIQSPEMPQPSPPEAMQSIYIEQEKHDDPNLKPTQVSSFAYKNSIEPILSPSLESLGRSALDKNLPILQISPIKSLVSIDDYSDIVAAMNFPDSNGSRYRFPDLFIRSVKKVKQLPLLKPITPRYAGKRMNLPKMRRDNEILLENLRAN